MNKEDTASWEEVLRTHPDMVSIAERRKLNNELRKAIDSSVFKIVVLDDDPTGIQTVHGVSVYTEWDESILKRAFLAESRLFFILTNSRGLTASQSKSLHENIAGNIASVSRSTGIPFIVISRGDSTLRGHYPFETQTLKEVLEKETGDVFDGEILCPFFPEGGRYTVDNIHYVRSGDVLVPAGLTEFAKDRTFGYLSSHLGEWVEEKTEGAYRKGDLTYISIDRLRSGNVDAICADLVRVANFSKVIVNAIEYADIETFTLALLKALSLGKRFLFRTAAAFPKIIGGIDDQPLLMRSDLLDQSVANGGLIIIGSHVAKTTAQLDALRTVPGIRFVELDTHLVVDPSAFAGEVGRVRALCNESLNDGVTTVLYTRRDRYDVNSGDKEDELRVAVTISESLTGIAGTLEKKPRFMIGKGGITSSDIGTKALKVKQALVLGQVLPGIPVWLTGPESTFPDMPYIIFPGNVGDEDALKTIVEMLM